jgi:polar amino acid transport system substrate-binding protein
MVRFSRIAGLFAITAVVATACSSAATPAPTSAPATPPPATAQPATQAPATQAPATQAPATEAPATEAPATEAPATEAPSAAPSFEIVATVPADQLLFPDKLVVCSDMPYPPLEYFDAEGNPIGSDIEMAQGIADRLGLQLEVVNSVFDTIIPALTGGKCDIIVSFQNITADRLEQVDMVMYYEAGQAFLVQAGNPDNIQAMEDLCGKKIAVEAGTTMLDFLGGTGDFEATGLPSVCATANLPAAEPKPYQKDSDAVAALQSGTASAYLADFPVAAGYALDLPDQFALAPLPQIAPAPVGISVAKTNTGLRDAVKAALLSMIADGSYLDILTQYGIESGAVTADQVNAPPQ